MVVIHNVLIVDKSSSMKGEKYDAAIAGIKLELNELRSDENAFYTQTIVEFSSGLNDELTNVEHCFMVPLRNVREFGGVGAYGNTPMYQTIGEVLEKLARFVNPDEKVLVKIFTDGQENTSKGKYKDPLILKALIDKLEAENGFTITFEGTKFDGERIHQEVGINFSKMKFHENTGVSMLNNVRSRVSATKAYSEGLSRGVDIGQTFYMNTEEDKKDGVQ